MSSDSLAALRKSVGTEFAQLAEQHMQHDLQQSDRDALQSAASKLSTHVTIGSALGLGLGLYSAFRLRRARTQYFNAIRAGEKPTAVRFADGREQALPDLTPMMKPSTLGDVATYTFLGFGGLFLGGESGLLTGGFSARRAIGRDMESQKRIEAGFRRFRADVLRKEADALDRGEGGMSSMGL